MKKGLKAVLLALVALSCAAGVALAQEGWVILHYIVGDGGHMNPEYVAKITEWGGEKENPIGIALANGVEVYAQYFPHYSDEPVVRLRGVLESSYRSYSGELRGVGRWEEVERLSPSGQMDPLDPEVFVEAISWVRRMAPGKRVLFLFESHGSGWRGVGLPLHGFEPGTPRRWRAIAEKVKERGSVDFLTFNSCLSALPEILSAMEGIAPWVQAWGWVTAGGGAITAYYDSPLWKDALDGEDLARRIIEGAGKYGEEKPSGRSQTVFRLDRMKGILQVLREMAQRDRDGLIEAIEEATRRMPEHDTYNLCDVAYLVEALKKRGMDSDRLIRAWGEALLDGSVAGRTDLWEGLSGLLTLGGEDLSEEVIRDYAACCEEFAFLQPSGSTPGPDDDSSGDDIPDDDIPDDDGGENDERAEGGGGCSIGSAGSPIFLTALVLFVAANLRR